ncbi:MAG: DUF4215 domain-containing protein [Deltaproteobacteria bacterium]|nr:DUF4215 domain-containing protein [Deltaproteobacteria bacterium]
MTICNCKSIYPYVVFTVCAFVVIAYLSSCTKLKSLDDDEQEGPPEENDEDVANGLKSTPERDSTVPDSLSEAESMPDSENDEPNDSEPNFSAGGGDTGPNQAEHCIEEGALRCVASESAERQVCRDGVWVSAVPCREGEVCDDSNPSQPGRCIYESTPCSGITERSICVDDTMHECGVNALSVSQQRCKSRQHCLIGLAVKTCAECIPRQDYFCNGNNLEICADDGLVFKLYDVCPSADQCNGDIGACVVVPDCVVDGDCSTTEACKKAVCKNGKCATAIDEGASCGVNDDGICAPSGECVECLEDRHCSFPTPICEPEKRICVECFVNSDCEDDEVCASNECAYVPKCGNGIIEGGEQCDDGNRYDFDGCGANCRFRTCDPDWACVLGTDLCYCSDKEWCVWNRQEGSESRWGCVLMCERNSDCPNFGYSRSTNCVNRGCYFDCRTNSDCPTGLVCRTEVINGISVTGCAF